MSFYAKLAEEKLKASGMSDQEGEYYSNVTKVAFNCSKGLLKFVDEDGKEHEYYVSYIYMLGDEWFLKWDYPWIIIEWDTDRYNCDIKIYNGIAYLGLKLK